MNRNSIGKTCQLAAVVIVVCSLIPRLQLFYFENGHWLKRDHYEVAYWSYLMIRAWIIALVGVVFGVVLFWLGSRLKSKSSSAKNNVSKFSGKRLAGVLVLIFSGLVVLVALPFIPAFFEKLRQNANPIVVSTTNHFTDADARSNLQATAARMMSLRVRASELDEQQRAEFQANFQKKYKPVIDKWCEAYQGHLPFAPENLTADKFVERIGRSASYFNYTFVLDGTTLCVEDSRNGVFVSYLNAPQAKQLMQLPKGQQPLPNTSVERQKITQMLTLDSGAQFKPDEIRITPTAFSTGINGGAYVEVGGDPNNAVTWKYTLVFGADGKLVYYMRGHDTLIRQKSD
jgi:hypothetical protein